MSDLFDAPFAPEMFVDTCRVRVLETSTGKTGSPRESHGAPGPRLACCVRFADDREAQSAPADAAEIAATVAFPRDPGVSRGDLLDTSSGSFRATGPARKQDASGRLWVVRCADVD